MQATQKQNMELNVQPEARGCSPFILAAAYTGLWLSSAALWLAVWYLWHTDGLRYVAGLGGALIGIAALDDMLVLFGTKRHVDPMVWFGVYLIPPLFAFGLLERYREACGDHGGKDSLNQLWDGP